MSLLPDSRRRFTDDIRFSRFITKRGMENVHVLLWALKDLSWMRIWDYRWIMVCGAMALSWSLWQLTADIYTIFTPKMKDPALFSLYIKEIPVTFAQTLWLFANVWWAIGECYDLRNNACFCDVYTQFGTQAEIPLYLAWAVEVLICVYTFSQAMMPTAMNYMAMFQDFVVWRYVRDMRSHGVKVPIGDHSLIGEALQASSIAHKRMTADIEMAVPEPKDHILDVELTITSSSDVNDVPKEEYERPDLPGMPRMFWGLTRIPVGQPHLTTGEVVTKGTWVYNPGLISYRDFELMILLFWISKDAAWLWEDGPAAIFWTIGSIGVVGVAAVALYCTLKYSFCFVEKGHSIGLFFWIISNVIWAYGEIWVSEEIEGVPELPADAIRFLAPPLLTRPSDLPPGSWKLRFIASWIMFVNIVGLFALYIYVAFCSLRRSIVRKRNLEAGSIVDERD